MRALSISFVSIAAVLCAFGAPAWADDDPLAAIEKRQQSLFEQISPAVVHVSTGEVFGSGFLVSKDGLIVTNAHVVKGHNAVKVVLSDGRTFDGRVLKRAPDGIDLALVRIEGHGLPTVTLAMRPDLRVGAWVASIGHGRGAIWSFNTGMISNIYSEGEDRPVFQTQIPLNPGNSGGPVIDRHGQVVGVVTAGINDAQSINFAIRSEVVLRSFAEVPGNCECLTIAAPPEVPVFVDGKMVGKGPRVVLPVQPGTYEVFVVVDGAMKRIRVRYPDEKTVEFK
jgi:S1-C subfamily serine protease